MPWCPKCKNEYYEGVKICADCGCELVDSLEEYEKAEKEAKIAELQKMLKEAEGELAEIEENLSEIAPEEEKEESEEAGKKKSVIPSRGVYRNFEEKADDNKSSAYTLLGVGGLGAVGVILCLAGVLDAPMSGTMKAIMLLVMGTIFVLFIVMGVISLKNAGDYAKRAASENEMTKELEKWYAENITAEKVDRELFTEEEADFSEEQKYFKRSERMKEFISEHFMNLDEGYLNRFVDEHYQEVFPDNDEEETEAV